MRILVFGARSDHRRHLALASATGLRRFVFAEVRLDLQSTDLAIGHGDASSGRSVRSR